MSDTRDDQNTAPRQANAEGKAAGNAAKRILDDEARGQIDRLRERYPTARALLLPALHIAQNRNGGWLSDDAIDEVARELELDPAEVYGVVSFYDLYYQKPVGRHRLSVCTNVSCMLRGSDRVLETLAGELGVGEGEVTPDGRCSYVHFECLGSCDTAPMMMVDNRYEENLTPERVKEILAELS